MRRAAFHMRQLAAPADLPVGIDEARAHVRVNHGGDDALITGMIAAAVSELDGYTGVLGRALISQQWAVDFDGGFPCHEIALPLKRLITVDAVGYHDADGVQESLAPEAYAAFPGERCSIAPLYQSVWPVARTQRQAVTIEFTAGYGAEAADVPAAIRSAILLIVGDLYENREAQMFDARAVIVENPTVDRLLSPYRVITF